MSDRADLAIRDGIELVGIVHDFGPDTVEEFLRSRSRADLEGLAVALAAMVPTDRTPTQLLRWLDPEHARAEQNRRRRVLRAGAPVERALKECGTHAAFVRHKSRGESIDELCAAGERLYQRKRPRDRKKAA